MYGKSQRRRHLIEPPFRLESHRYQTILAADWIAGLVGRLGAIWADSGAGPRTRRSAAVSSIASIASAAGVEPETRIHGPQPMVHYHARLRFALRRRSVTDCAAIGDGAVSGTVAGNSGRETGRLASFAPGSENEA